MPACLGSEDSHDVKGWMMIMASGTRSKVSAPPQDSQL